MWWVTAAPKNSEAQRSSLGLVDLTSVSLLHRSYRLFVFFLSKGMAADSQREHTGSECDRLAARMASPSLLR